MGPLSETAPPTTAKATIRRIATAATGLAAFALTGGMLAVGGFFAMPTAVSAAALSSWIMWSCLKPDHMDDEISPLAAGRCLGLGCLLGGLNAVPSFLLTTICLGETSWVTEIPVVVLMVAVAGVFVGVPLGLLFSAFYTIPIGRARVLSNGDAVEAADHMLRSTGTWLTGMALGAFIVGSLIGVASCGEIFGRSDRWEMMIPLVISCAPAFLTGLVFLLIGMGNLRARRAWLERVLSGREPGWDIVPRGERLADAAKARPLLVEHEDATHILVRVEPGAAQGAYRTGQELIPWALIAMGGAPDASTNNDDADGDAPHAT